jgi:hypothetical protein
MKYTDALRYMISTQYKEVYCIEDPNNEYSTGLTVFTHPTKEILLIIQEGMIKNLHGYLHSVKAYATCHKDAQLLHLPYSKVMTHGYEHDKTEKVGLLMMIDGYSRENCRPRVLCDFIEEYSSEISDKMTHLPRIHIDLYQASRSESSRVIKDCGLDPNYRCYYKHPQYRGKNKVDYVVDLQTD